MEHLKYLQSKDACDKAIEFAQKFPTLQEAWNKCERGDWMLWMIGKQAGIIDSMSRKKLCYVATQCARLALDYTKDDRVLNCIETCERYYKGELILQDVRDAATYAYFADAYVAYSAAASAYSAAAAYASASADADKKDMLKKCANIVRSHYPKIRMT